MPILHYMPAPCSSVHILQSVLLISCQSIYSVFFLGLSLHRYQTAFNPLMRESPPILYQKLIAVSCISSLFICFDCSLLSEELRQIFTNTTVTELCLCLSLQTDWDKDDFGQWAILCVVFMYLCVCVWKTYSKQMKNELCYIKTSQPIIVCTVLG